MAILESVNSSEFIPNRFNGRVLIVTGAAAGSIGGCVALRAGREGACVFCVDRKVTELHQTVEQINASGGRASGHVTDVSNTESVNGMVAECVQKFGKLDLALNAAGVMDGTDPTHPPDFANQRSLLPSPIHLATDAYWNAVLTNNITSMFVSLRAELRQMVTQGTGGAIVNVGSIAGLTGLPGNPAYSASKHAVVGLTRNAAIDYAPYGIRVNSVNMAQTETPMVFRANEFVKWVRQQGGGSSMAGAKSKSLLQLANPDNRGSSPWDQAAVILFLLSSDAANLTGLAMATDGGWTAY